jgi:nucleoside-diphosphate-sugar epimerase
VIGVTGSGGYVGSCIVRHLRAAGSQVIEFHSSPVIGNDRARKFRLQEQPVPSEFAGVDVLVHCAYDFGVLGWEEIQSVNVEGTRRLFEAASLGGVRRFVLISSISAFEGCKSLYGRGKLEAEAIAAKLGAVIIRPGLVFGPNSGGMMLALDRLATFPIAVPMVGSGEAIQYLAHESDLARLVSAVIERPADAGVAPISAAHPSGISLRGIMTVLCLAGGRRPHFIGIPSPMIAAVLAVAESAGLRLKFRRDSLVSLLSQNDAPDFACIERLGIAFRPFSASSLKP